MAVRVQPWRIPEGFPVNPPCRGFRVKGLGFRVLGFRGLKNMTVTWGTVFVTGTGETKDAKHTLSNASKEPYIHSRKQDIQSHHRIHIDMRNFGSTRAWTVYIPVAYTAEIECRPSEYVGFGDHAMTPQGSGFKGFRVHRAPSRLQRG